MKDLTLNLVSINPRYFKLTVSWSLNESSGHRGGYELQFTNYDERISACYCLVNSNKTRVTISYVRYESWNGYKSTQLFSYPGPTKNGMNVSLLLSLIRDCADIQHNGTLCGTRPYSKPSNLTVESSWCGSENKSMRITWDPPSVASDVPLQSIYYIYIHSIPFFLRFGQSVVRVGIPDTRQLVFQIHTSSLELKRHSKEWIGPNSSQHLTSPEVSSRCYWRKQTETKSPSSHSLGNSGLK